MVALPSVVIRKESIGAATQIPLCLPGLMEQEMYRRRAWRWNTSHTRLENVTDSTHSTLTDENIHQGLFLC